MLSPEIEKYRVAERERWLSSMTPADRDLCNAWRDTIIQVGWEVSRPYLDQFIIYISNKYLLPQ
jgi:hypothetical protein